MFYSSSVLTLIAANLIPFFGALFLNWNIGSVLLSYWVESVIIGFYNILRMWKVGEGEYIIFKVAPIIFFIFHYGFFVAISGFIYIRFVSDLTHLSMLLAGFPTKEVLFSAAALSTSHGVSFYKNFIGKNEFRRLRVGDLLFQPYRRIMVMFSTIVLGTVITMLFNLEPTVGVIAVFVLLKIIVDAGAHVSEHKRFGSLPFGPGGLYADLHGNRR